MIKFLDLHHQYVSIKDEIDTAIASVIRDSAYIGGEYVKQFEEEFSSYLQTKHCVGVGNGTDALEIAIEALDLPEGSEIIVPANSFIASAEAISRTGHKIVFCDVNSDDYTINIEDVKGRISANTSAIMAVHLYGHPCNMSELLELGKEHNLKIIEDCAQAHGAEYKGNKIGCIGDIGCFSFYPGKNLGAYGDAGAIVVNDEKLAQKCRMIANHGRIAKYNHDFEGRNSRMDGLQAAILAVKLKHLDDWTNHRILIANTYMEELKNSSDFILPIKQKWAKHVYHLFVVRHPRRDHWKKILSDSEIQTGIHYPVALPKLKAFKHLKQNNNNGFAWHSDADLLSLPIGKHILKKDVKVISEKLMGE
jgi:dTDP-4-amino-4,6-dideoxygalactose transaminase